jgi:hypothetical protein
MKEKIFSFSFFVKVKHLILSDVCACGNSLKYEKNSDSECDLFCSGNFGETCGGSSGYFTVISTGNFQN